MEIINSAVNRAIKIERLGFSGYNRIGVVVRIHRYEMHTWMDSCEAYKKNTQYAQV